MTTKDVQRISKQIWDAKQAIEDILNRLGVDYLDLMLLHQPVGDYLGAWKAMGEAVSTGKIKVIGLSNFNNRT